MSKDEEIDVAENIRKAKETLAASRTAKTQDGGQEVIPKGKTSKAKITIEDAFKPAIVNAFLAWVTKLNPEDYPRQKAVINQFKQYSKGNTFVQLLDLFQIFLESKRD